MSAALNLWISYAMELVFVVIVPLVPIGIQGMIKALASFSAQLFYFSPGLTSWLF